MIGRVILSSLLGSVVAYEKDGEVIIGTVDNFDSLIKEGDLLAEFYAPWCGHCKKLDPEYKKAAEELVADGVKTKLVKIDATVETKLATDHGVNGYPTLKYFVGGTASDYDGPRDAAGIVAWIKTMSGPAVQEGEPKDTDVLAVVYYGAKAEDFEKLAKANRKAATWYHSPKSEEKLVVKHLGEDAIESKVTDFAEMETAFKKSSFPLFGGLDGDTFGKYMSRENGMIWTLLDMTAENVKEKVEEVRPMMTEIAQELGTDYSVTWTNTVEFGKVLESMFGIKEFPRMVVQTKVGDKKNFIYNGAIDKESMMKYITDVKEGKIQSHLKSEEEPAEQSEPVKVIVGKTLEKMMFQADKDVLLEVYAPWCGHCKKLEPEYTKVAKKVAKEGFEDILVIAKMDGTQNDSPIDSISWSGFPTIYYAKAGDSTPVKYDGGRDAKGIWKWIKKNHSKADVIKEKLAAKSSKKEEL